MKNTNSILNSKEKRGEKSIRFTFLFKPTSDEIFHWLKNGCEFKGTPASSNPQGGIDSVDYSGIVLKIWGRCDLRSWTQNEYDYIQPDGNGGTKKGSWPADLLFNGPCDPASPTATGPGYTGYSAAAGSPVYGGTNICIDKRNNNLYLGMNFKSVTSGGSPDFEPAVIAMNESGTMLWWSRLYHEITPAGDTMESVPDQYVDALAIDYSNNKLVVGARCHGNNIENFWEGNQIASCLLYTSPSPRDRTRSRMPSSA